MPWLCLPSRAGVAAPHTRPHRGDFARGLWPHLQQQYCTSLTLQEAANMSSIPAQCGRPRQHLQIVHRAAEPATPSMINLLVMTVSRPAGVMLRLAGRCWCTLLTSLSWLRGKVALTWPSPQT